MNINESNHQGHWHCHQWIHGRPLMTEKINPIGSHLRIDEANMISIYYLRRRLTENSGGFEHGDDVPSKSKQQASDAKAR